MYLSKLVLNLDNSFARQDIANPYEMHRTLKWLVSNVEDRLLWRLEARDSWEPVLLVQTINLPDWSEVFRRNGSDYGELALDSPKEFNPSFSPGQVLRFRLKANPTVMRNRKRYGLCREDDLFAWLSRQMNEAGSELLDVAVLAKERVVALKKGTKGRITLHSVLFEGRIRVLEPEELIVRLCSGIGRGKALGFGLLSLARG